MVTASSLDSRIGRAFYGSFARLTNAQAKAEQPLLDGLDVVVVSGTASGKTVAVLAPLVQRHLLAQRRHVQGAVVYVAPTKALANDVVRRVEPPLEALGISVGLRHGDAPRVVQSQRAEVLVITPESLDVMVSARPDFLREVRAVVIDEAHLLYNTQRGLQLAILIRRLEARRGSAIQVVGLSATIASPRHLWSFFRPYVDKGGLAIIDAEAGRLIEAVVRIERVQGEFATLVERLGQREHCKVLVFTNSRRVADRLAEEIQGGAAFKGAVFVHHSSIGGDYRERAEREFAVRARAACVATSTLELGIDIGDVDLVILYGLVGGWESFLQRIGRGNRRGDRAKVLCVTPHDAPHKWLTALTFLSTLRAARSGGGDAVDPMALHGAIVQQILSMLREKKGSYVRLAEIAAVMSAWPHLSREAVDAITDALVEGGLCVRHGFQNRIGAGERLYELERLRLLWGNFPARSREVPLRANGREIGAVPVSNLARLSAGMRIRFAGRTWTITDLQPSRIDLVPARGRATGVEIGYLGKGPGIDPVALESARQILLDRSWELNDLGTREADECDSRWRDLNRLLVDADLPFARENGGYRYLTFAGRLVNDVICRWHDVVGCEIDDLCIWSPCPIHFHGVPTDPRLLGDQATESLTRAGELTIFQSMLPSDLLNQDVLEPWCRTPYYARTLQRLGSSEPHEIEGVRFQAVLA